MEHKPIVEKLLAHYKDVYGSVNGMVSIYEIMNTLHETDTSCGVCSCASGKFGIYIYDELWVKNYGYYWGRYPMYGNAKETVLERLQIRIDNLTKELELINSKQIVNN